MTKFATPPLPIHKYISRAYPRSRQPGSLSHRTRKSVSQQSPRMELDLYASVSDFDDDAIPPSNPPSLSPSPPGFQPPAAAAGQDRSVLFPTTVSLPPAAAVLQGGKHHPFQKIRSELSRRRVQFSRTMRKVDLFRLLQESNDSQEELGEARALASRSRSVPQRAARSSATARGSAFPEPVSHGRRHLTSPQGHATSPPRRATPRPCNTDKRHYDIVL